MRAAFTGSVIILGLCVSASASAQNENTAYGTSALVNPTGNFNTGVGYEAASLTSTGKRNAAFGRDALYANTTGSENTALGTEVLASSTTASGNTGVGAYSLLYTTTGTDNTAVGWSTLYSNTTGIFNTAVGYSAESSQTTASYNTAVGFLALTSDTTGNQNTAVGEDTLADDTTGFRNTGVGMAAFESLNTGAENVALGYQAGGGLTTGNDNTYVGTNAGFMNQTGSNNIAIGDGSGANGSFTNTAAFGVNAAPTANGMLILGGTNTLSIKLTQDYTLVSDGRFKTAVTENVPGLKFIEKLRPVTYHLDQDKLDAFQGQPTLASDPVSGEAREFKMRQVNTGFIAQEVEAAAQACGYDFSGVAKPLNERTPYGLSYDQFVVPLVKAVQEQQQQIEELRASLKVANAASKQAEGAQHAGLFGSGSWQSGWALLGVAWLVSQRKKRSS